MPRAFGLDFGTTNSALASVELGSGVKLAQFNGKSTFRSIIYFEEEDERSLSRKLRVVAGPDAIQDYLSAKTPGRLIQSLKSHLASRLFTETQIFGDTYTLEQLIGIPLRQLRNRAEAQFGDLGSTLVVGRPVHFSGAHDCNDDEFAVHRLRQAFENAGFHRIDLLPEPVAAAFQYQRDLTREELVLIADFGGGTSDFSLLRLKPGRLDLDEMSKLVLGNDGVGVAGDSFDGTLVRNLVAPRLGIRSKYRTQFGKLLPMPFWIYEHLEHWHHLSFLKTRKNMQTLRQLHFQAVEPSMIEALIELVDSDLGYRLYNTIEQSKCALSEKPSTAFRFSERAINIEADLSIDQFEAWIEPKVEQINSCIGRLLRQCDVVPKDIDAVYMTGGSSFVPAIRRLFERTFVGVPIRSGQEFTSVAEGLGLYAAELYR